MLMKINKICCRKALNYNTYGYMSRFTKSPEQLNFYQQPDRLEHQTALNERVKANTVNVSLNFDATDKPGKEMLTMIANS